MHTLSSANQVPCFCRHMGKKSLLLNPFTLIANLIDCWETATKPSAYVNDAGKVFNVKPFLLLKLSMAAVNHSDKATRLSSVLFQHMLLQDRLCFITHIQCTSMGDTRW